MNPFELAIQFVLPHETEFVRGHFGDFSKEEYVRTEGDPDDRGGRTRYGIDQRSHPNVIIDRLTREDAIAIYRTEWDSHNLDRLPAALAILVFDVLVNGGPAFKWLQMAYNDTHPGGEQLVVDGVIGPKTLRLLQNADEDRMIDFFIEDRDARFVRLAKVPSQRKFLNGWTQRDRDLKRFLKLV